MRRGAGWAMLLLMMGQAAVAAHGAAAATPPNAARDAQWRAEIRRRLHVPATLPPLGLRVWSEFSPAAGVRAERVTYNTADGMMVPAIVYHPDTPRGARQKLPGIVVVNGHGSDKFGWYAFWSGIEFARAGAVVVTYDMIGEGERNAEKSSQANAHDKLPLEYGTRLAGLMQVDLMQAVTLLGSWRDVDARRIAVVGYSMGSFVAGITGAIDPRIHAIALSGAGVYDGAGGYYDSGRLPCQMPPYRAPLLLMNGTADAVMDLPHHGPEWFAGLRAQTIALHGGEGNVFTTIFYQGISHRTSWVNRDGFLWLDEQIHFADWTRERIEAAPLTHISEWAKANGVFIAKNYMSEDREGGLMAVGDDVPGVGREDLMVLQAKDWERLKARLTFEAWAAKIEARYRPEPVAAVEEPKK